LTGQAPAFNPFDARFLEDPFPFYEWGRRESPVTFHAAANTWSVFRYDDVTAVLKDNASWSSSFPPPPGFGDETPSMLTSDPPAHTRLRRLVSQAFTPRMVEQLEPRIERIARELLDAVEGEQRIDIVSALAYPLPVIVIAEILGVPPDDRDRFKRWSSDLVATLGSSIGPGGPPPAPATIDEMGAYFSAMADERRTRPRNDLISALVAAEFEGDRLSFAELIRMLILLLVAGNETTTNLIGNAVLAFANHRVQLARVLDRPELLPAAVEEVLRYSSPVQATVRRATRDIELAGQSIKQGDRAVVWLASANRDERQFAHSADFDVSRTPNRHVSFGLGIHFCLGAPLARLEARVALAAFLDRYRTFQRAGSGPLSRVPTFIMRGVTELPVVVTARG